MKVLQVCQPAEGGVVHYVHVLSAELMARGWTAGVACSPGTPTDRLRGEGVDVWPVPMAREISPRRDLMATIRLYKIMRKGGYSLVHTHSAKAGVLGRVAARLARTPAVHTPNAWSFMVAKTPLERRAYVTVEKLLSALSKRIICVSSDELKQGQDLVGAAKKMRLVPNGVAVPPRAKKRSGEKDLVVGCLTRLARQKGIDYLVAAANGVRAEREDVRFSVAGGGPDFERLKDEVGRRGLSGRFELLGAVRDPWEYLSRIDIFVLPSLWEGMPFALLEAMSFGLPVVATDVGGVRDVIPDDTFGIVVPPADPHALREAILRYARAPELREAAGGAARRRVLQEFSQERMVERTLDVYREVLGC